MRVILDELTNPTVIDIDELNHYNCPDCWPVTKDAKVALCGTSLENSEVSSIVDIDCIVCNMIEECPACGCLF